MSENFACSNCRMLLQISSEQFGKQVRCPVCGSISVFGSPAEESQQSDKRDDWSPINESPTTPSPPREERNTDRAGPQPLKASSDQLGGNWEKVRPAPTNPNRKSDNTKPAADTFVIDENQVAENQSKFDRNWKIGFVLSLLPVVAIASPFCTCCVYLPFVPLGLGLLGIAFTSRSKRGPKELNYILAGISIVFALFYLAFFLIGIFLG
jgi:phage FluMu protein Com